MRVLSIFGTRPEAIKMAPVVRELARHAAIESRVCVTGQHRHMLRSILDLFEIKPEWDLDVMQPEQSLNGLVARIIAAVDPVFDAFPADFVLVHGDTSTALAAGMAAFHRRSAVAHVEAGLRTYDLMQPWPEEMNRRALDAFAGVLFPPTPGARRNLLAEGLAARRIVVTGNTVIDALLATRARLQGDEARRAKIARRYPQAFRDDRRLLLVTGHRRENFGDGFQAICRALRRLADRDDIQIVYPVHLNPNVRRPVLELLGGLDRVSLIEPLDYVDFVALMDRAHVILTDSGGVQEEAPTLGKPVLVMRDVTERPEAVEAGTVRLVGADTERIVCGVASLFDDPAEYSSMARAVNPYGDGHAAGRIVATLLGEQVKDFAVDVA